MRGLQNRTMSIERFMGCGYTYHVIGTRLDNSHMITTDNINLASAVAMSQAARLLTNLKYLYRTPNLINSMDE